MSDVSRPRKRAVRFEDINKYRRKSVRVYYIVEDDLNVHINDAINHGINNPVLISTSYQSAINDPIHGAVWKEAA